MKICGGDTEAGIVVGNAYDKYGSGNPVVRRIMRGYEQALCELIRRANPHSIHEVGCGEGYWVWRWTDQGIATRGTDFSLKAIELAQENAVEKNLPDDIFNVRNVYDLHPDQDGADLVACCEVLEHLERPEEALRALRSVARPFLLLSVPREPLWSLMNIARGKYLSEFGNSPGHIHRWSRKAFIRLVSGYFDVVEVRYPIPFTIVLCSLPSSKN